MPEVERLADVDAFVAVAGAFLEAREAEHNLILGICSNLRAGTRPAVAGPVDFAIVRTSGTPVLAAIRTPPYHLVLSEVDDGAAIPALAEVFAHVLVVGDPAVLRGRRFGNLVLAASDAPFDEGRLRRVTARAHPRARVAEGRAFAAGARPGTDADPPTVPTPPADLFAP